MKEGDGEGISGLVRRLLWFAAGTTLAVTGGVMLRDALRQPGGDVHDVVPGIGVWVMSLGLALILKGLMRLRDY